MSAVIPGSDRAPDSDAAASLPPVGTDGTAPGAAGDPDGAGSPAGRAALERVLGLLDVRPDPDGAPDTFTAGSEPTPWGRVFGGQVLAQGLMAACRTVEPARVVHSLHGYFLRAGDPEQPITLSVERLRDGRSFSARRTHALQGGVPILSMISSFQVPATGLDHQVTMPAVPQPEDLPTAHQEHSDRGGPELPDTLRHPPVELRHVEGSMLLAGDRERVAHQAVWMRAAGPMPDDPVLHTVLATFASDYSLLESILRRHGLAWTTRGLRVASLDHAMWFHRPLRFDDWLLYVQESPSASGARGMGFGRIFSRDGVLLAETAQEGMLRVPPAPP